MNNQSPLFLHHSIGSTHYYKQYVLFASYQKFERLTFFADKQTVIVPLSAPYTANVALLGWKTMRGQTNTHI
jgi:hypothetical protein